MKNVKKIALQIFAQQVQGLPLMSRGKPNDLNNQSQGMDEAQQKMYDGKDRSHVTYDQLEVFDESKGKKRKFCDWIDKETLLNDLMDTKMSKKKAGTDSNYLEEGQGWTSGNPGQRSYPYSHEDELEYYYHNPKGKGDAIDDAVFMGIDKPAEVIKQDFPLSFTNIEDMLPVLKDKTQDPTEKYHRDETEKYPTTDQPLYNKRYWQEQINPSQHSV